MRRLLAGLLVTVAVLSSSAAAAGADTVAAARWRLQNTPNPARSTVSDLSGVSCSSAIVCTAVGNYAHSLNSPEHTLADRSYDGSWTVKRTGHPAAATGSGLSEVSCSSVKACTAVGNYASKTDSNGSAFGEVWNGSSWTPEATAKPAGAAGSQLLGVSCSSTTACTAVGSYTNRSGSWALAESWNGTIWSLQTVPKPAGAIFSRFQAVSCSSPTACIAVGYYAGSAAVGQTFAEQWNGSSWRVQTTPIPAGATNSELLGISCASPRACTAVGSYGNSAGAEVTLGETWNGSSWHIENTPNPPGAVQAALSGVSCTAASACTAVGYYSSGNLAPPTALAESQIGSPWSLQALPNRADTMASALFDVSCTSASACTAVGYYETTSGEVFDLADRYS